MKIAICDDDSAQTEYLSSLVRKWACKVGTCADIKTFNSAESFQFVWSEDKSTDILLLDIQMPGQNGMELAKAIRREDEQISIVFITGFSDYMSEGYEVSALHYLLKPVREEQLFSCLDRAFLKQKEEKPPLLLESGGEKVRIRQEEIVYLEAFAHTVAVTTPGQNFETRSSLGELQKSLDSGMFLRPHRSYLVNIKYIQKIDKTELTLDSGCRIPVSRRLYNDVNKAFIHFYKGWES